MPHEIFLNWHLCCCATYYIMHVSFMTISVLLFNYPCVHLYHHLGTYSLLCFHPLPSPSPLSSPPPLSPNHHHQAQLEILMFGHEETRQITNFLSNWHRRNLHLHLIKFPFMNVYFLLHGDGYRDLNWGRSLSINFYGLDENKNSRK